MRNKKDRKFLHILEKSGTYILLCISIICFSLSFIQYQHHQNISKECETINRKVNHRVSILDSYAEKALNTDTHQWLDIPNLPDDMVIYKYVSDTIQSWVNLFPIHNDIIKKRTPWYIFHNLSNTNPFNTPFAYLNEHPQFLNLGNSWYIIKSYRKDNTTIIGGLLVKTEYSTQNAILKNSTNKKLGIDAQYTPIPVWIDDANVVVLKDNTPIFSIIKISSIPSRTPFTLFRWGAILFAGLAVFYYHFRKRSKKSLILTLVALLLLRITALTLSRVTFHYADFFSPSSYADGVFFNSLGTIVLNHIFMFLDILALFMMRISIIRNIRHSSKFWKWVKLSFAGVVPIFLFLYIHFTLKSIILNSSIDLELYHIAGITIYSITTFFSYALLFSALLLSLQFVSLCINTSNHSSILTTKGIMFYLVLISAYSVFIIARYGFVKEIEQNRLITTKLGIDRDLDLELHLRSIESHIQNDPIISFLVGVPNNGDIIKNRLEELYFWNQTSKYDLRITICRQGDLLRVDNYSRPVDCFGFFHNEILDKYGISLGPLSKFYSLNNNNSYINYFGHFSYIRAGELYYLFLEIDSKKVNETLGYPSLMIDSKVAYRKNLPDIYSYAKYYDNKLVAYDGKYNYPLVNENIYNDRYSYYFKDGYVHFINKTSNGGIVVVTREKRSMVAYIVTFSYLFIFYYIVLIVLFRFKRNKSKHKGRHRERHNERDSLTPKSSFRRKITFSITTSLVVAIACVGAGSILFIIRLFEENNRSIMEDKLVSIHTTVSNLCKYYNGDTDIANQDLLSKIRDLASNTQVDINLFSPKGKLLTTTKDDVFEMYLVSSRINPKVYKELIFDNEKQVISKEYIANLDYYSLYAPVFNINGKFIAILNIPYFLDTSTLKEDATPIIATIINIFMILIMAAILYSRMLSNSLANPVVMISKKMQELNIYQKGEHIQYHGNDELAILVKAYNDMMDDLEESTKKLAESEREQAWKDMARHIAHEIKNPLTPMQLSIQHLVRLKKQGVENWDEKFYSTSASLLEQINIISQTASEFSSFAKFYNEDNKAFDMIGIINDQLLFFDNRDNIKFEFVHTIPQAIIFAKKDQITRVLVNLISNAIQAIEHKNNGLIKISVTIQDKSYLFSVEDNGDGVKPENKYKLFKPNFTTKSSGTGLGLAICKSIIDQSNGSIYYSDSIELGGAKFTFTLPTYQKG